MKLRVIRKCAIEFKIHQPGAVIDVPDADLAGRLVSDGFASQFTDLPVVETAQVDLENETADAPVTKGRGRRK